MRRAIILGSAAATILALAYLLPMVGGSSVDRWGTPGAEAQTLAANDNVQALTLDPKQFVGTARDAYTFAGKDPKLLAQLHCYCGCDRTLGHQSLLDCYRGTHAAGCEICIQEALMAKVMSEQGSPVDQIREAIRRNFAGDY